MLKEVGEAASRMAPLVLAAGFHPDLGADNRRGMVLVEDDGETTREGVTGGGRAGKFHAGG